MNINKVLMEYDNMFGINSMDEIEDFLIKMLDVANEEKDDYSAITLMNEIIGFYRDTSQNHKGIKICGQLIRQMELLGIEGTVEYATSLLNIANAYRAFGLYEESNRLYSEVEKIYRDKLAAGEFNYASLYNNWSLLYQETEEFENAKKMLLKALSIVDLFPKAVIQQANTRTNLANTLLRLDEMDDAMKYLNEAIDIYKKDGERDFHYSAALSAMGDALFMQEKYEEASVYYKRAMQEIEKHTGITESYTRVEDKYNTAVKRISVGQSDREMSDNEVVEQETCTSNKYSANPHIFNNNLERCKAFYETYGAPMIHEQFAEYENRIAVGLVGEGSDCFGFDDEISMDHDYGVGFCMWLTDEDYEQIGYALHKVYERLVLEHAEEFLEINHGVYEQSINKFMDNRRGVFSISTFYNNLLGVDKLVLDENQWLEISEDKLATATNGMVFRDDLHVFSDIRKRLLEYYPRKIWLIKLAEKIHVFSQVAQSNYARMMARKDYVTASVCVADGMRYAMEIVYLLNKTYAPYYKWLRLGMNTLNSLYEIPYLLDSIATERLQEDAWDGPYNPYELNRYDSVVVRFEDIAGRILDALVANGIVNGTNTFLDVYVKGIYEMALLRKDELIEQIVRTEWQQFDKVKNEGGRADCQDDWNTFSLMRKSQYMAWSEELLVSYLRDLESAGRNGWNLIMEKYARMMQSTAPDRYNELSGELPERSDERIAIQEQIIEIQVGWMEQFASKYPKMAGNARSIHTYEDNPYNTSYETYLRGELGTYSDETLVLYGRYIVELQRTDKNLAYMIMQNTANLYGYKSVDDAENRL